MTQTAEDWHARVMRTGGYPLYMGHRGGGGGETGPENTLYACERAAQCKRIRCLEIDVRSTRDAALILMHDSSVDRTTDGQGAVDSYTLAELKRLDAGHTHPTLRGTGITVPTLDEFLAAFVERYPELLFVFDFKDEATIQKAWPLIQSYGAQLHGRYMMGSVFEAPNLMLGRLCDAEAEAGHPRPPLISDMTQTFEMVLAHGTGLWPLYSFGRHDVFGYVLQSKSDAFLTKSLIKALHQKGMRVLACGPNLAQTSVMQHCIKCEVDYIMVDDACTCK